jgi:hypothetical protein
MKLAILILAHKNPKQLAHLVKSLSHSETAIFIHLDAKSNRNEFQTEFDLQSVLPEYMIQKIDIVYSSITYIEATLILMKEAISQGCNYFVLLSGLDMPLKPIQHIVDFFKTNQEKDYFDFTPIPYTKLGYQGRTRTDFYNFKVRNQMETLFPPKQIEHQMSWKGKLLNYWLLIINRGKTLRTFPMGHQPYYSSQWWNLSLESVNYIIDFIEKNPAYYKWYQKALHPEEMFFQTILLNSPRKNFAENNNLRHIRWKEGKKHPELIDISELAQISQSTDALFARKFDLQK